MNDGNGSKYRVYFLLVLFFCLSCSQSNPGNVNFEQQPFNVADYGLFDLGVADMNDDGRLDIFTTNHSGEQSVMLNRGSNGFEDVYVPWKMDQDHRFPGLAIAPQEPPMETPGIYINWVGPDVVVRAYRMGDGKPASGRIEVFTSVKIGTKQNFNVEVVEKEVSPEVDHSVIEFSGQGDGYFTFRPYNHALPFQFYFDANVAAELIHVGKHHISPKEPDFSFLLRDRHGMVWADFNNDDQTDVFITRGGERGLMGELPMPFWDELFIGTSTVMEDVGIEVGLAKKGCPGRQAGLIDYNRDGLLDVYVVCGRNPGSYPNMLFQQNNDGHFEDVAAAVGLDIPSNGSFVWLDVDLDRDMDLFWSDNNGFFLYRNDAGKYSTIPLESFNRKGFGSKHTVSDFDNDGDLDIFSASGDGNVLFVNSGGDLSAVLPGSVGLPEKSATANWVDYDNDGRMDLHTIPAGLYVQKGEGKFIETSLLSTPQKKFSPFDFMDARSAWFDIDNNGTRDLLLATQWRAKKAKWAKWWVKILELDKPFGGLNYFWKVARFNNQNVNNHWLQVQLKGPPSNRQAIGAMVTLQTADQQQVQQVGQADGSHFSQGHYRLYFGLGRQSEPLLLRVDWPDGKMTEVVRPPGDQLLTIDWQETS